MWIAIGNDDANGGFRKDVCRDPADEYVCFPDVLELCLAHGQCTQVPAAQTAAEFGSVVDIDWSAETKTASPSTPSLKRYCIWFPAGSVRCSMRSPFGS